MCKKFCSLLLAAAMLTLPFQAYAIDADNTQRFVIGHIYDEEGNLVEAVEGRVISVTPKRISDEVRVTYAVDLSTNAEYELTAHSPDSGHASTVYLTIGYKYAEAWMCLLTSVSGYWVISDPKASVESASVHYECTGLGFQSITNTICFE